ncbi:MAG: SCO family protein [Anaerolineales bacterium]|nr:SCO family protein [Anaerolineales bacterium]
MNKRLVMFVVGAVLLTAVVGCALEISKKQLAFRGSEIDPPMPAAPIRLQRLDGKLYDLAEQNGRVVVLYFGYTYCPDYCPGTLAKLQVVFDRLGEQAADVDVVLVTTDPDRDTAEVVDEYARHFNPTFIGLSGSEEALNPIWLDYFVGRQIVPMPESALGYTVNHSTRAYVIDKDGNLRLTFPFELQANDILHDLLLLLAEE